MFSAACENHVMGAPHKGETICYCGTVLCNQCCAINSAFILISFLLICNGPVIDRLLYFFTLWLPNPTSTFVLVVFVVLLRRKQYVKGKNAGAYLAEEGNENK